MIVTCGEDNSVQQDTKYYCLVTYSNGNNHNILMIVTEVRSVNQGHVCYYCAKQTSSLPIAVGISEKAIIQFPAVSISWRLDFSDLHYAIGSGFKFTTQKYSATHLPFVTWGV